MNLVRVVAPHFVAGLIVDRYDRVVEAAPIVRYMRGWDGNKVRAYVQGKGWRASRVADATGGTVEGAAAMAATEESGMNNPNPNPNDPRQNPPGAPHTPEPPRHVPEPDDESDHDDENEGADTRRVR